MFLCSPARNSDIDEGIGYFKGFDFNMGTCQLSQFHKVRYNDASEIPCDLAISMNSQPTSYCTETLPQFAASHKIFLDESRREFLNRNERILGELVLGNLVGMNRFRELLLGLKSVGISTMLKTLHDFVGKKYGGQIISVLISYDATFRRPTAVICDLMIRNGVISSDEAEKWLATDDIATIFQALEGRLLLKEKYLLLLVDDFQCVYSFLRGTGVPIVQEIAFISDSDLGCTHLIVSGSSKLYKLAFAKLKISDVGDRSTYESYMSQNLNSTKLQPHWIVPITKPEDFRGLIRMKIPSLTEEADIVRHFICSGGRPGMLRLKSDLDSSSGLPQSMWYSFSAKHLATGNDIRSKILSCILQCSIKKDGNFEARISSLYQNEDDENWNSLRDKDLERLCSLLALVPVSVIRKSLDVTIDDKEFGEALYDLADEGHILFNENNQSTKHVAIADPYLLLELNFNRKK